MGGVTPSIFKGKSPGNEVVIYCHRSQILRSPPLVKSQGELNYQHHLGTACKHRHINFLRGETSLCIFEALLWSLHCDCLQKSKEAPGYKVCGEKRHSERCLCFDSYSLLGLVYLKQYQLHWICLFSMPLKMVYTVEKVKHLTIWNLFLLSLSEDCGKRSLAF